MMANVIQLPTTAWGATPDEWAHLAFVLGLREDLLPVVSNPKAVISPQSNMGAVGKTPSIYNGRRQVAGFPQWTQHTTNDDQIALWSADRDYGICLQTRVVRALDIDVEDPAKAQAIRAFIDARHALPARTRNNSGKLLLVLECKGDLFKRRFKTDGGIVEFLATGQQFIACGTHTSGARYEWEGGLPDDIPVLTMDQVEALWSALTAQFATEDAAVSGASTKHHTLANAVSSDPRAQFLIDNGHAKRIERDGRIHVECPNADEHSTDSGDSSSTYWPAHTGGYEKGAFKCLHAHCEHLTVADLDEAIGYVESFTDEFAAIPEAAIPASDDGPTPITDDATPSDTPATVQASRFQVVPISERVQNRKPVRYLVKHVVPRGEIVVVFGESGSGKTFMVLDLAMAIAQGLDWRGNRTTQGRVVYVASEDATGVHDRADAYARHHQINLADIPFGTIDAAPNLLVKSEVVEVARQIQAGGPCALVVIDTLSKSIPGADENSAKDMGLALSHCLGIHRATGATVMLVHHSGKDSSKGARGWSGLKAGVDAELEVIRNQDAREMSVTKLKNGQDGAKFGFKLYPVVLGFDEDGDEIGSCVIEHNDLTIPKSNKKLGVNELLAIRLAQDTVSLGGEIIFKELLDKMVEQMAHDPSKSDKRRSNAIRTINALIAKGALNQQGGVLTIPSAQ